MSIESELYNLKMKILRSKHISDQLREELANDVFEIESSIQAKNNEVLDLVMLSDVKGDVDTQKSDAVSTDGDEQETDGRTSASRSSGSDESETQSADE